MKKDMHGYTIRKGGLYKKERRVALLFVAIPILGFLIFTLVTMGFSLYYSFTNFNPIKHDSIAEAPFVLFKNYTDLFGKYGEQFTTSVENTVIMLISVPVGILLGMIFAGLLSSRINAKASKAFRIIYYIPAISSAVAINIIWRYIFNNEFGIINSALGVKIPWLSDDALIKVAIIIKNIWGGFGGTLIMFLAGILNIPDSYYEAAKIDGASQWQQFWRITVPLLSPITFYQLIVGIIAGFQSYADSAVFAGGDQGARTIVYFIWQYGINDGKYGLASAASFLLAIVIMIITIVQFKVSDKWVYEG